MSDMTKNEFQWVCGHVIMKKNKTRNTETFCTLYGCRSMFSLILNRRADSVCASIVFFSIYGNLEYLGQTVIDCQGGSRIHPLRCRKAQSIFKVEFEKQSGSLYCNAIPGTRTHGGNGFKRIQAEALSLHCNPNWQAVLITVGDIYRPGGK